MAWQVLIIERGTPYASTAIQGEGDTEAAAIEMAVKNAISDYGIEPACEYDFACLVQQYEGCGFIVALHNSTPNE